MSEKTGTKRTRSERRGSSVDESKSSKRSKAAAAKVCEKEEEEEEEKEWTNQQMAEDYVSLASRLMMYPLTHRKLGPFGYSIMDQQKASPFPLERMSALAYLQSAVRRPTVVEQWSPYDIAIFEAAITTHGKDFFKVQKEIPSKTTKDVIEFYYIWKKTSHYTKWKKEFIPTQITDDEKSAGECHIADS